MSEVVPCVNAELVCEPDEAKMICIPFTLIEADIHFAIQKSVAQRIKHTRERLPLTTKAHVSPLLANIYFGEESTISLTNEKMGYVLGSATRKV